MPRTIVSTVLAILVLASSSPGQDWPPPDKVDVILGESYLIQKGPHVKSVFVSNEKVAEVKFLPEGGLLVLGKELGTSLIHVFPDKKTDPKAGPPLSIRVRVVRDSGRYQDLAAFINKKFAGSRVTIEFTPDTTSAVVSGTVPDDKTARQVLVMIHGAGLPSAAIMNRLKVECLPEPVGPFPGLLGWPH
jgi:Flp pilus assembly secretin CpaC